MPACSDCDSETKIQVQVVYLGSDPGNAGVGAERWDWKANEVSQEHVDMQVPTVGSQASGGQCGTYSSVIHTRGEGAGALAHRVPSPATETQSPAQTRPAPPPA